LWIKTLQELLVEKCAKAPLAHAELTRLFGDANKSAVGCWLIQERFINMPPCIAPPMFRLLLQEASDAGLKVCFD
jgi:hypothetical protein